MEAARIGLFLAFDYFYSDRMLKNVFFRSTLVHSLFHGFYLLSASTMLVRHFIAKYN